jgi:hypothetical protein
MSKNIFKGKTTVDPTYLSKRVSEYLGHTSRSGGKSRKHKRTHKNRTIKRT